MARRTNHGYSTRLPSLWIDPVDTMEIGHWTPRPTRHRHRPRHNTQHPTRHPAQYQPRQYGSHMNRPAYPGSVANCRPQYDQMPNLRDLIPGSDIHAAPGNPVPTQQRQSGRDSVRPSTQNIASNDASSSNNQTSAGGVSEFPEATSSGADANTRVNKRRSPDDLKNPVSEFSDHDVRSFEKPLLEVSNDNGGRSGKSNDPLLEASDCEDQETDDEGKARDAKMDPGNCSENEPLDK